MDYLPVKTNHSVNFIKTSSEPYINKSFLQSINLRLSSSTSTLFALMFFITL